jgi:hypothetical protein
LRQEALLLTQFELLVLLRGEKHLLRLAIGCHHQAVGLAFGRQVHLGTTAPAATATAAPSQGRVTGLAGRLWPGFGRIGIGVVPLVVVELRGLGGGRCGSQVLGVGVFVRIHEALSEQKGGESPSAKDVLFRTETKGGAGWAEPPGFWMPTGQPHAVSADTGRSLTAFSKKCERYCT